MRYETIRTFMTNWLNGLITKGIISQMPEFINTQPQIDKTTPWDPKLSPQDPKYTKHQFVETEINAEGQEEVKKIFTPEFEKVKTSRTEQSTTNDYNVALFYNYSYAPGSVLGMSQSEAEALPGALLTMNREFILKNSIEKLNLSSFKAKITPNGGQTVPVIILKAMSSSGVPDSPNYWSKWNAYVSKSYNLEIPFAVDSKQFQSAWLFIYWYIKKGFPQDWDFIGNKPDNVDWNLIDLEQLQSSGAPKYSETMAIQREEWRKLPMDWYANMVKKVYQS
jgi:hypothetical protein